MNMNSYGVIIPEPAKQHTKQNKNVKTKFGRIVIKHSKQIIAKETVQLK